MQEEIILNFVLGFVLLILALMFLYGYFHNSYKRKFSFAFDPDEIFFKDKKELIRESDKLAFWVCSLMSVLTAGNGVLILFSKNIPNISIVFVVIGVAGSWLTKYIFMNYYKNFPATLIPKLWPSGRMRNRLSKMENLIEFLKEFEVFLQKYKTNHSKHLREYREKFEAGIEYENTLADFEVLTFGGSGSFRDLIILKSNGHQIEEQNEDRVNRELKTYVEKLKLLVKAATKETPNYKSHFNRQPD